MQTNLKELAEKIANQDNEGTQNPIFWVRDKERRYSFNDDYETATGVEVKEDCYVCESCQDFYQANPNREDNRDCVNHFSNPDSDEGECEGSSGLVEYIEEYVIKYEPGFFLTREAAEQHIKDNAHHYNNPIIRCGHLWRNHEMLGVINKIFEVSGVKKPHFYN